MAPSDLKISHLRAFAAVAQSGGYHPAAKRLGCSQPTVTQHVLKLEARLGRRLLERARRGHPGRLTEAGQRLLPHALNILRLHDRMLAARAPPSRPNGRFRPIGADRTE